MKKYIDRDRLLEDLKKRSYSKASLILILDQPEADVIPMWWIEYWLDEQYANHNNSLHDAVIDMLDDWRKENETD